MAVSVSVVVYLCANAADRAVPIGDLWAYQFTTTLTILPFVAINRRGGTEIVDRTKRPCESMH